MRQHPMQRYDIWWGGQKRTLSRTDSRCPRKSRRWRPCRTLELLPVGIECQQRLKRWGNMHIALCRIVAYDQHVISFQPSTTYWHHVPASCGIQQKPSAICPKVLPDCNLNIKYTRVRSKYGYQGYGVYAKQQLRRLKFKI